MRLPASEREVAATSSSRGWSQTIFAASAPVNPFAPATSTRAAGAPSSGWVGSLFTERPTDLLQLAEDRGAGGLDLLVGQRPVGGAKLERQRQALLARAELLAFIKVEDLDRAQQLATAGPHRGDHVCRGGVGG